MSEIFPLRFRGYAVGIAVFAQWLSNAAVTFFFPILIASLGGPTFFIFAAINVGTFLFLWKFLPETKGRSLEGFEKELETGVVEIIPDTLQR
ncbi:MFS transporter, partial [Bacillus sp. S34]|nr:MFS transporter [Bacillus sp. S34]